LIRNIPIKMDEFTLDGEIVDISSELCLTLDEKVNSKMTHTPKILD
jgi:hypothetical protein